MADAPDSTAVAPTVDDQRSRSGGGVLEAGERLGRYVVLEHIGAGGMGTVYAARDPELDRVVAIKLLSSEVGAGPMTLRLEREARAMARLSDPHVVAVHDVGRLGGRLFIAMEYVVGGTLAERLAGGGLPWRSVVDLFLGAGRGLVAAHEAGIVHRDFKPANVLIDRSGRARVSDFGLARADADVEPADDAGSGSGDTSLGVALTREGAVVGTPRYMAPEQHLRQPVTARTDQFSFCVALWEAVYGQPPFAGSSMAALASAVLAGRIEAPPSRKAPGWLERILRRGLRAEPAERWESMAALLEALERGRRRRTNALVAAGVTTAMVATGVAAVWVAGGEAAPAGIDCAGAGAEVDALWNDDARARLTAAFAATGRPYAATTAQRVAAGFDDYAARWRTMKVDSCRATHERGDQSQELLDARSSCLATRRAELARLLGLLSASPPPELVDRAQTVAGHLPEIADCERIDPIRSKWRPPAAIAEQVDAVDRATDDVQSLIDRGDYAAAIAAGRPLAARAIALGHARLTGRVHAVFGEALDRGSIDIAGTSAVLQRAVDEASAAGDDATAAFAWQTLLHLAGTDHEHPDRLAGIEPAARAASIRTGDVDVERTYWFTLGMVRYERGARAEALEACGRALELGERNGRTDIADEIICMAQVHRDAGDLAKARPLMERALKVREVQYGPDHPIMADALQQMGIIETRSGRFAESLAYNRRALAIRERVYGPDSLEVSITLNSIGAAILNAHGDFQEARGLLERALRIAVATGDRSISGTVRTTLANVLDWLEQSPEARAMMEQALRDVEASDGPEHPKVAEVLFNFGNMLIYDDMCDRATELFMRADAIYARTTPDAPIRAAPLTGAAQCLIGAGKYAEALPALESAFALFEHAASSPFNQAVVEGYLGEALIASGRDRSRGIRLVRQAIQRMHESGFAAERDGLRRWLRDRGIAEK